MTKKKKADQEEAKTAAKASADAETAKLTAEQKKADAQQKKQAAHDQKKAERAKKHAERQKKQAERAEHQAEKARKRAEAKASQRAAKERKERVIHTRVPESLEQELKDRAGALGVSVSNLVRNVLSHTFGMVEDMLQDSAVLARSARPNPPTPPTPPTPPDPTIEPTVFGWQRCSLSVNALCESCNDILPKGTEAAVAVMNIPAQRPRAMCLPCLEKELDA